jgi:hypothetical protein
MGKEVLKLEQVYRDRGTAIQTGRSRVRFPMASLEFFIDMILPAALWLWGRLSANRNEYQEYFLGVKGSRCVGLTTLPPSCADCLEILGASTSWNPQGLSWPVMGLLYLYIGTAVAGVPVAIQYYRI